MVDSQFIFRYMHYELDYVLGYVPFLKFPAKSTKTVKISYKDMYKTYNNKLSKKHTI